MVVFKEVDKSIPFTVPEGSILAYAKDAEWRYFDCFSKYFGDNATWAFDNGTLTISGTGAMWNYDMADNKAPWYSLIADIAALSIAEGITQIGNNAFNGCTTLTEITSLATTPPTLGTDVFYGVDKSIPVIVPVSSLSAYTTPSNWGGFTNMVYGKCGDAAYWAVDGTTLKITGPGAMWNYDMADNKAPWYRLIADIAALSIAAGITQIGNNAFHGCSALIEITSLATTQSTLGAIEFCG